MRFAVLHHLEGAGDEPPTAVYDEVTEQVRVAGELGFDTAWVAEHHFSATKGRVPSPLLFLVHLAGNSRGIRVGSAVLPAPFYESVRLAEEIALADCLTGGRLACGISSSGVPDEMRVFGVAQEGKHERLRETLLWLRRAWSGESVESLPGDSTSELVTIVPRPIQSLDDMLWVAASSSTAARVAGELGYHLLLPSLRPLKASAEHATTYRATLSENGFSPSNRFVQVTQHLVLHDDHDTAMRIAQPIVRAYYERYTASGAVKPLDDESLPSIMARINFLAGGPEAVAERIVHVGGVLGLTHVAFQARLIGLSNAQVLHGLELLQTRVAPLVTSAERRRETAQAVVRISAP